jgi:hypothetical protein
MTKKPSERIEEIMSSKDVVYSGDLLKTIIEVMDELYEDIIKDNN